MFNSNLLIAARISSSLFRVQEEPYHFTFSRKFYVKTYCSFAGRSEMLIPKNFD